jgi:NAD(P)-dependent dehydrogenase (short-subunit alcohol dehydrogenase family)
MLIESANVHENSLQGKTVLLTGGGGGIGLEAAKALAWMGANVVIAEIDREKGQAAERQINGQLHTDRALFYPIDLAEREQIAALCAFLKDKFGFVDVVFNNATVASMGAVSDVDIAEWDRSYAVNLRAPVLLAQRNGVQQQLKARVRANLTELDRQLVAQSMCSRLRIEGGWYGVLRVPVTRADEDLAIELLQRGNVLVQPGYFYDFQGDGYLVVSLITPEKTFGEGVRRLLAGI